MNSINTAYESLSQKIIQAGETAKELFNCHRKFNAGSKPHKWERMQDVYGLLSQSFTNWGSENIILESTLRKQVDNTSLYLKKTFEYTRREFDSFSQLIRFRNTVSQEYFKAHTELDLKKEKHFALGDISKWEVDFNQQKVTAAELSKNKKLAKEHMFPVVRLVYTANTPGEGDGKSVWLCQRPISGAVRTRRPQKSKKIFESTYGALHGQPSSLY